MRPEVKRFNKAFKALLKEVKRAAPDDAGMSTILVAFKFMKHTQPSLPARMFNDLIVKPYADRIQARDLAFFLDPAFKVPGFEDTCDNMRTVLQALPASVMSRVWEHVGALMDVNAALHPGAPSET